MLIFGIVLHKRVLILFAILVLWLASIGVGLGQHGFVKVDGTQFEIDGKTYHYIGANFWQAMNLASKGATGKRDQLLLELDNLENMGVTNLRIMAGTEGPNTSPYRVVPAMQVAPGEYDQDLLDGLDFVLSEMSKRNMKAVMCLNNFWHWSGGMGQYLLWANEADSIPYPPPHPNGTWGGYQRFTAKFYSSKKATKLFDDHIKFILKRRNLYSNQDYIDDPTIMAWELGNEPRGVNNYSAYYNWIEKTSGLIKKLDPNHLVTIGSEGLTGHPVQAGNDFLKDHSLDAIDYCCTHIWIENFEWYNPRNPEKTYLKSLDKAKDYLDEHVRMAKELNKPLVLEEFGCARDSSSYNPNNPVSWRNHYFNQLFEHVYQNNSVVAGANFWAWAGSQRPGSIEGKMWSEGESVIGDPPHEIQGWYSVYDTDLTTISIISEYANRMRLLD